MGTSFTLALAVFLVVTIIVMIIAERKDPRPSRVYAIISVFAVIALTLLVTRELIMLNVTSLP